jgi:hypothetical protein
MVKRFQGYTPLQDKIFLQEMYCDGWQIVTVKRGVIFDYIYFSTDDERVKNKIL